MRWFKHYADAQTSTALAELKHKYGFEGYGRFWALLEFLCSKYDGRSVEFEIHQDVLRDLLKMRSWKQLESFVDCVRNVPGMIADRSGNVYRLNASILSELKGRDYKKARCERGLGAVLARSKANLSSNPSNSDAQQSNISSRSEKPKFDFETPYQKYPRKLGKKKGIEKIKREIKTEQRYNLFCQAVNNYALYVEHEAVESKYIKHFSTFVGCWEDWITYQRPLGPVDIIEIATLEAGNEQVKSVWDQEND